MTTDLRTQEPDKPKFVYCCTERRRLCGPLDGTQVMALNCKRCGKHNIDDEAYAAWSGGFMCRRCYWTHRLWRAVVLIPLACLFFYLAVKIYQS